ncbi:DUF1903-domain-containing protein [Calocera viscosa TUFC12733]|uniref:Cx9C motif-containing protein 4, mitochondrial n=1 Tax=Calocera viscosa (strain TUFC12733) TaxID=1330018 RepID=A0A167P192_CALVF|nr:DUF1903-domain-containing protein [Calocera viscosa TUFC12733]
MPNPPCQAQACTLQDCLSLHTYTPSRCSRQMYALYACCASMYDGRLPGEERESTACPMESVTRRWLAQHPKEEGKKAEQ